MIIASRCGCMYFDDGELRAEDNTQVGWCEDHGGQAK